MLYRCPFCQRDTTVLNDRVSNSVHKLDISNKANIVHLFSEFIVCPNAACQQASLTIRLFNDFQGRMMYSQCWQVLPESKAIPLPEYISDQIRNDYEEAALIVAKSAKASATLSRRCLQGMIRDFWRVKPGRLYDEINAIKDKVDPELWEAIDGLRKIGNIGAHMENDVNLIVDVEPDEAEKLIWLIELLVSEWYVRRYERQQGLAAVRQMALEKSEQKKAVENSGEAKAAAKE
jgi:hypothetical protein